MHKSPLKKLKSRTGKRPIRADNLLKKSSQSGADLRLPVMGGVKFPTNDSLSESKKQLKESQDIARPKMVRPTLHSVLPDYKKMAMAGDDMSIENDPLIQYLKKCAEETPPPPKNPKVESDGKLEVNKEEMELGEPEQEYISVDSDPKEPYVEKKHNDWKGYLDQMFENQKDVKRKYTDKDDPYKENIVVKVLKETGAKIDSE